MTFSCVALMCSRGFTEHVTATEPKRRLRKMFCMAHGVARAPLDGGGDDVGDGDDVDVGVCGASGEAKRRIARAARVDACCAVRSAATSATLRASLTVRLHGAMIKDLRRTRELCFCTTVL